MSVMRDSTPSAQEERPTFLTPSPSILRFCLLFLVIAAFGIFTAGIPLNLPYFAEMDEVIFVQPAVQMVAESSLNPGWFGNPGSTIFYPLSGLYLFLDFTTAL
ncbi:hypothetical protein V6O07_11430, partial [Arthrospira platensis SPKY2]